MVIEIMIINFKPTFTSNLPVEHIYIFMFYTPYLSTNCGPLVGVLCASLLTSNHFAVNIDCSSRRYCLSLY